MDIAIVGRDIEIARYDERRMARQRILQVRSNRFAPRQLVSVFFRIDDLPVRHVRANDANAGDRCRDQTFLLVNEIVDTGNDVDDIETPSGETLMIGWIDGTR